MVHDGIQTQMSLLLMFLVFNVHQERNSDVVTIFTQFKNREIGLIPVNIKGDGVYVRIWEENLRNNESNGRVSNECLYIGANLDCSKLMCRDLNNGINDKNINEICKFETFKLKELDIPTFIETDFPLCRIYNLKDAADFGDIIRNLHNNNVNICKCLGEEDTKLFSPQMGNKKGNNSGGWKLEVIESAYNIPEIYPSNRYIINVRVLIDPGWNFEFALVYKNLSGKLSDYSYSVVSFKKDINCYGFPEEESLKTLQSFVFFKDNSYIYQKFTWKSPSLNGDSNILNLKYPVNELATTHYYICYYPHYNSNSGHNIGSIYFRLDPEDAAKTFSLLIFIASIAPMLVFFIYIIIGAKHKTNINKLQGFILLENRNNLTKIFQ
ncbi:hypothetical protein FG386_000562 [Cryptosporidium ryanae]|uniref:uncharacterized protein n=1 Tax=Cryptosporidium ryanae TaxID=515981 RepID=UPI00351A8C65|nr:hypothetical protein FG386_000562 [Cryptosporidium ryanae]